MNYTFRFSLFLVCIPVSAYAGHLDMRRQLMTMVGACSQLLEPVLHAVVEDHSNKPIQVFNSEREVIHAIELGRRMGRGFFGSVYVVDGILPSEIVPFTTLKMTVKLPHYLREFEWAGPMLHAEPAPRRELENYHFILSQISKLENDSQYPKNPAWNRGRLMVVPTLGSAETDRGLALFKPLVRGLFLKEIGARIHENGGELPVEMRQGLHDIYDLTQVIYRVVQVDGKIHYSTDIRPPNLIWVYEEEMLNLLGMSRPGFALFEIDRCPMDVDAFIEGSTTFENYEKLFLDYARASWEKISL